eukprot:TRINITY_DN12239_c0_g1_i7.p2 TRINITY_DN12239_c0_g1~~TRINITY_DN12239_c0_g1_i7.p2  ORF type:complete len:289 (+),score=21.98 TRINITY_DN12239_c0_g1_i7:171-1037(+)
MTDIQTLDEEQPQYERSLFGANPNPNSNPTNKYPHQNRQGRVGGGRIGGGGGGHVGRARFLGLVPPSDSMYLCCRMGLWPGVKLICISFVIYSVLWALAFFPKMSFVGRGQSFMEQLKTSWIALICMVLLVLAGTQGLKVMKFTHEFQTYQPTRLSYFAKWLTFVVVTWIVVLVLEILDTVMTMTSKNEEEQEVALPINFSILRIFRYICCVIGVYFVYIIWSCNVKLQEESRGTFIGKPIFERENVQPVQMQQLQQTQVKPYNGTNVSAVQQGYPPPYQVHLSSNVG